MQRLTIAGLFWVFLLTSCEDAPLDADLPAAHIEFKGYSHASFYNGAFADSESNGSLNILSEQTAAQWVALCVFEFQDNARSTNIEANYDGINPRTGGAFMSTSSIDDIRRGCEQAQQLNMRVMLKPHVDRYDGGWRGYIRPEDPAAWFESYKAMMLKYARVAEEEEIPMLCLGVEMVGVTGKEFTSKWRNLIAAVREVYSGDLTYSANWSRGEEGTQPEYRRIEFWRELDYVGVSLYTPLQDAGVDELPTLDMAQLRLLPIAGDIELLSREVNRPFLLTEVGARSARGALTGPWSLTSPPGEHYLDEAAQYLYYQAVLESFANRPRCRGFFWWNWPVVVNSAPRTDYGVQNKRAAGLLRSWYTES